MTCKIGVNSAKYAGKSYLELLNNHFLAQKQVIGMVMPVGGSGK
jgi:hypothetical protein